jgi:hypothetical protein
LYCFLAGVAFSILCSVLLWFLVRRPVAEGRERLAEGRKRSPGSFTTLGREAPPGEQNAEDVRRRLQEIERRLSELEKQKRE